MIMVQLLLMIHLALSHTVNAESHSSNAKMDEVLCRHEQLLRMKWIKTSTAHFTLNIWKTSMPPINLSQEILMSGKAGASLALSSIVASLNVGVRKEHKLFSRPV